MNEILVYNYVGNFQEIIRTYHEYRLAFQSGRNVTYNGKLCKIVNMSVDFPENNKINLSVTFQTIED